MAHINRSCFHMSALLFCCSIVIWLAGSGPAIAANDPPVTVEAVRKMPLVSKLELSGTVTSRRVSQISPQVPGLIQTVHYDAGGKVTAGEVLVELDAKLEEISRRQTMAQIEEAKAQLADARRRLKIAEGLAKREYGPQNTADTIKTEVAIRQAAIERLTAEKAASEERLERHTVRAPFDGIISRKLAEAGQWIVPGTAVFELVEMSRLRVELPVPQQYYAQILDDVDVELFFDALPDVKVRGQVDAIVPVSDPNARTFTLRVVPTKTDITITPGMSARASVGLQTGREGLVVSRDALLRQPDGRITVWVLEPNGDKPKVRERRVEIGLSFDGLTEIRSGLKLGDKVVVRGNETLSEGQSVRLAS